MGLFLRIGLLFFAAAAARAETVTLEPIKDNTLYEDDAGARSNGSGLHLFVGNASGSDLGRSRRALLAFDVAGGIPAGSTIVTARLTLNMSKTVSEQQSLALHRVLADWGEGSSTAVGEEGMGADAAPGDATWLHRFFDATLWTTPGGDFVESASATRSVGGIASYAWGSTTQMVADVQGWLDAPQTNFGWILIGNEDTSPTSKRFDSRENAASVRPRLEIDFEGGDPTPTATETPPPSATATPVADTETPTRSATQTETPTATPSETATDTPTATATPTLPPPCAGDCDRDGAVSVDELVRGIDVALGRPGLEDCELFDTGSDGVMLDDVVRAVRNALGGCEQ